MADWMTGGRKNWMTSSSFDVNKAREEYRERGRLRREQDEQLLRRQEAARAHEEEEKKKEEGLLDKTIDLAKGAGTGIVSGLQQGAGKVADTTIKAGAGIAVLGSDAFGGTQEEKDRRAAQFLETAEGARDFLKDRRDISGQNISGTKNIGLNDIQENPRKLVELGAEGLDVGLAATQFLNPTRIAANTARGGARGSTGLAIGGSSARMGFRQAAKFAGRDAAFFGGLEGARATGEVYGETGDVGRAIREGAMSGVQSGVLQGGLDVGGYAIGRGLNRNRTQPTDPTKEIDDTIDDLVTGIQTARSEAEAIANAKTAIRRRGKTYESGLADIESRMQEVETTEYQQMHNLTKADEGRARYEEIMADTENIPGFKEANESLERAEAEVKYYNEIRTSDPDFRRADRIRDKMSRIEAARQEDIANLEQMALDEASEFSPDAFPQLLEDINRQYDEAIAVEQGRLDEFLASKPDKAMEIQALDQAERVALEQRDAAQSAVDEVATQQEALARQEMEALASEPDPEKIQYHKEALQRQKELLQKALDDAKKRYENPNESLKDVNAELDSLDDGTHPLVEGKADPARIEKRKIELYEERGQQRVKEVEESVDQSTRELTDEQVTEIANIKSEEALNDSPYLREALEAKSNVFASILPAFQQNEAIMRHLGLHKLNELRLSSSRKHAALTFDSQRKMKRMAKEARGMKSSELFDAADGVPGAYDKLDPRGKALVDEWREWAKDLGTQLGLPLDVVMRGDYIPHLYAGKGNSPKILQLQTRMRDAIEKAQSGVDESEVKRLTTYIKKLDKEILELIEPDKRADYGNFVKDNGNIFNRFLEKRTGAEGYERNFMKAIDAYVDKANTQIAYEEYIKEAANIINKEGMDRSIATTLKSDIDNIRGIQAEIDKTMNMSSNKLVAQAGLEGTKLGDMLHNAPTKALRNTRILSSLAMFAGNIASGINALGQTPAIVASLNADGYVVGVLQTAKILANSGKETLTRAEVNSLDRYSRIGVFEGNSPFLPDRFADASPAAQNAYGALKGTTNTIIKASMSPLTGGDKMMRLITAQGAEYKGRQRGLSGEALDNYILETVRRANSDFSKLQAPRTFRSQVGKTVAQAVAWIPGMTFRLAESAVDAGKGASTIVGKVRGKDVTAGELMAAVDDITKAMSGAAAVWGVGILLDNITGQGEVVPNPFKKEFYNTPFIQRIVGNEKTGKAGLIGLLPSDSDRIEIDENGREINADHRDRVKSFFTDTLPRATVPGYSAYRRTKDAMEVNEQGYSETDSGRIRFQTDSDNDLQRLLFGQYSTEEGQEYIENMNRPGGGALSESQSNKVKNAPEGLQNQYYDFYRAADRVTGRTQANKEVTELFREGRPEAARRKAEEFNARVDRAMGEFFSKYPDMDEELVQELISNEYITLTPRSEAARTR